MRPYYTQPHFPNPTNYKYQKPTQPKPNSDFLKKSVQQIYTTNIFHDDLWRKKTNY